MRRAVVLLSVLCSGGSAFSQTTLNLASGTVTKGSAIQLNLSLLVSGSGPAGLQWMLSYPPSEITSVSVAPGPALSGAGKTLTCSSGTASVSCVASGMNGNSIASGVVAVVTANTSTGAVNSSDSIPLTAVMAAYPNATADTVTGSGGVITLAGQAPVITSAGSASGKVGSAFSYQITASNSPTSFGATGLPAGLSVNTSTGVISGTPTAAGNSSVTISATNAGGTGSATLALTVNPAAPVITSAGSATGTVGAAFAYQITASNSPTSFGANGLPAGLSVNTSTGVISGSPTAAGSASVTISATNAGGTGSTTLALTVNPGAPVISSPTSATGTVGTALTYQIAASNSPTSFGATGLPAGLSVNTSTGVISGSPTTAGNSSVTISATNAGGTGSATLALKVNPAAPVINSPTSATGTVGAAFTYQIAASNSPTSFGATGLPNGLSVNTTTGLISGSPTAAGNSSVTISATNATGTGTAALALTINPLGTPVINSPITASGVVGTAFSYQIAASNSPTSFGATGLPNGLSVNTTTGLISGTPSTAGTSNATVSATNAGGTGKATVTITIAHPAPVINSATSATGTVGKAFSYRITATNSPTSFSATGLPGGLSINTSTGVISGTPTTAGTSTVVLSATNVTGTGTATLTLTVVPPIPVISSPTTAAGVVGTAFTYQIVATNSPTRYAASGLPGSLSINTTTGVISGTPTKTGSWTVRLTASNAGGTGKAQLALTVTKTQPTAQTGLGASVADPRNSVRDLYCTPRVINAGAEASCQLRMAGSSDESVQVASSSAQVKAPTAVSTRANQASLTFRVTADPAAREQVATITATAGESTAQDTIQVTASSGPVLMAPAEQTGRVGKQLRFTVTADDPADLPVTLSAAQLPQGASFDATSGVLVWTPATAQRGSCRIAFGAANSAGQMANAEVLVRVGSAGPQITATERLACSPGALAVLKGSGFGEPGAEVADLSGNPDGLGGTSVTINHQSVPVVDVSETSVTFVCPALDPETPLEVVVAADSGASTTVHGKMLEATPRILTADSGREAQGKISFPDTTELAAPRDFRDLGQPAQPGDEVVIWATGLDGQAIQVSIGGIEAEVLSIDSAEGYAGVKMIHVRVPAAIGYGDAVPVQLQATTASGRQFTSKTATMAVEPAGQ